MLFCHGNIGIGGAVPPIQNIGGGRVGSCPPNSIMMTICINERKMNDDRGESGYTV